MKTSTIGKRLIQTHEGCRLRAYKCPAGVWTIGYGHTGPDVGPRSVITMAEAEALLEKDLQKFENGVSSACAPITPNQAEFDAMVSLAFNVGLANFRKSSVLRLFKKGNKAGAANAFGLWIKARNPRTRQLEVLPGLVKRRAEEKDLFLTTPTARSVERATSGSKTVTVPEASVVPEAPKPLSKSREIAGGAVVGVGGVGQLIKEFSVEDAKDVKTGIQDIRTSEEPFLEQIHATEIAAGLTVFISMFIIWKRITDRKDGIR